MPTEGLLSNNFALQEFRILLLKHKCAATSVAVLCTRVKYAQKF